MVKRIRKLTTPIALLACLCVTAAFLFFSVPSRSLYDRHDASHLQQGFVIPQAGNTNETFPFEKTAAALIISKLHLGQCGGCIIALPRDLVVFLFIHSVFYTCIAINAP